MGQRDHENTDEPQKIDIQVGEPFVSQIDYSLSEEELDAYCDRQMELMRNGQDELATIELMMLGYALDFIDFVKNEVQTDISFAEENLGLFDAVLETLHELVAEGGLTQDDFNDVVNRGHFPMSDTSFAPFSFSHSPYHLQKAQPRQGCCSSARLSFRRFCPQNSSAGRCAGLARPPSCLPI